MRFLAACNRWMWRGGPAQVPSVILHLGGESTHSGHYHAFVKRNDQVWLCNDSTVQVAHQKAMDTALRDGYLYFYQTTRARQDPEDASEGRPSSEV